MRSKLLIIRNLFLIGILSVLFSFSAFSQSTRPRYSKAPSQGNDIIAEDTIISVRINDTLSSKTARVGDRFTATVSIPVYVGGRLAIPSGAVVSGRVTQVTQAKRMNKPGVLAIEFDEISLPNGLSTQIVGVLTSDDPEIQKQIDDENRVSGGKSKDSSVLIGGSGVLGAILGGVAGGGKGAAVGGAVGAGIGAASVYFTKGEEATVPAGTTFGLRLKQSIPMPDDSSTNSTDNSGVSSRNDSAIPTRDTAANTRERSSQPTLGREEAKGKDITLPSTQPTSKEEEKNTSSEPVPIKEELPEVEVNLPLSSPEMIRRSQSALHQEGYYEGEIDGSLNPRTVKALKTYQKDHNLTETGTLDEETAKSLKIIGNRTVQRESRITKPVSRPTSQPTNDPNESLRSPSTSSESQNQITKEAAGGTLPNQVNFTAANLQKQAEELLSNYQRMIGVRITGTGVVFDNKSTFTDDDINLLFAIDSFVNATQLYGRILPGLQTQQAIRSATLSMAREARKTDRDFTTSSSRWINSLTPQWDTIRQGILKLMYMYNIKTADLDN